MKWEGRVVAARGWVCHLLLRFALGVRAEQFIERMFGNEEAPPNANDGKIAAADGFVGECAADAERGGSLFDADGEAP